MRSEYDRVMIDKNNAFLLNGRESTNYFLVLVKPAERFKRYADIFQVTKEQAENIFGGHPISRDDAVKVYDMLLEEDRFHNYSASTSPEVTALYVLYYADANFAGEKIDVRYLTEILSMPGIGDIQDALQAIETVSKKSFVVDDYPYSLALTKEGVKLMENVVAEVSRQDRLMTDFGNEIHIDNSGFDILKFALPPVMAILGAARKNDVKALHNMDKEIDSEIGIGASGSRAERLRGLFY